MTCIHIHNHYNCISRCSPLPHIIAKYFLFHVVLAKYIWLHAICVICPKSTSKPLRLCLFVRVCMTNLAVVTSAPVMMTGRLPPQYPQQKYYQPMRATANDFIGNTVSISVFQHMWERELITFCLYLYLR